MRIIILTVMGLVLAAGPSWAAESDKEKAATPSQEVQAENPYIEEMNDKARNLAGSLSETEVVVLGQIRENFGIIRSIGVARETVGNAVEMCADKNPELKDQITARHKEWHQAIGTELEKQEEALQQAVSEDRFENAEEIQDYFNTIDKAAEYADSNIEKKIVTTPEACTNLMESMDKTQDVITAMVSGLEWPSDQANGEDAP